MLLDAEDLIRHVMTTVIAFPRLARMAGIHSSMKSALVPGAGSRGRAYADYSLSHPDETRCEAFRKRYGLEMLSRAVPLYDLRFVDEQRLPVVLLG